MPNEIKIEDIKVLENSRSKLEKIPEMMQSIKQQGLIEPIVVADTHQGEYILLAGHTRLHALKKLGYTTLTIGKDVVVRDEEQKPEQMLLVNVTENVVRTDLNPLELGKACWRLKEEFKLTESEIAVRLSMSKTAVDTAIRLYRDTPDEFRDNIGYINRNRAKLGKISPSIMNRVINTQYLSKAAKRDILQYAQHEELTIGQVEIICRMVTAGISVDKAKATYNRVKRAHIDLLVDKEVALALEKEHSKGIYTLLREAAQGKITLPSKLFIKIEKKSA